MVKMVTTSGYILSLMMMAGQGSDGSYGSNKCCWCELWTWFDCKILIETTNVNCTLNLRAPWIES